TPTAPGTYSVTATVSDGTLAASRTFSWTILRANSAPSLTAVPNQTSTAGRALAFQLRGADPDDDPLTFTATGLPPGLAVNAATGSIAGTPTAPGTYRVTATVSDGTLTASRTFVWVVNANAAPRLRNPGDQ